MATDHSFPTPLATHIRYVPFGPPASWIWGQGTVAARRFDQDGRPTELPFTARGQRQIAYDPASRITALRDPAQRAHDQTYTYDLLDRLTGWTSYGSWQRYHYDANGNRTRVELNGLPYATITAADSNRLLSAAGSDRTRVFRYDAAGQIVGDGLITWTYNDRGRLAAVTRPGPVIGPFIRVDPAGVRHVSVTRGPPISVRYTHDAFGQRLKKTGTLGTTHFVYDEQGQLLGDYDESGAVVQEYVYLAGHLLGIVRGQAAEIFYAYTDPVGRPWVITDTQDRPRWQWPLAPFGDRPPSENPSGLGPFTLNLRFPGQYFDQETQTHYNTFRDYDPQIGRYLQADPIGLAGGINTYLYVGGNPLGFVDPDGLRVLNPRNFPVSPDVMNALWEMNRMIGCDKDIVITGGDRDSTSTIGAGSGSPHVQGIAADIYVPGQSHLETANQASASNLFGGVGWYQEDYRGPRGEGPHVHVDLRSGPPARWGYPARGPRMRGYFPAYEVKLNPKNCGCQP